MRSQSSTLDRLVASGRIAVVGALYDVTTGDIEFLSDVPETSPHTQIRPFHKRAPTGH
jgi:carbonic anhydrase/SulP family sulfate permease